MKLTVELEVDTDNTEDRNTIETVIELFDDIKQALENKQSKVKRK